jgi:hypothetical protein
MTMTSTTYTITNRTSGLCLGAYSASTELDAVEAMAIDAGYDSLDRMAERMAVVEHLPTEKSTRSGGRFFSEISAHHCCLH